MPNQQSNVNPRLRNSFLELITLMKHKAEDRGLKPVITVAKITDMLKSAGMRITYQQLVDLTQDPMISRSIKAINKNQIELSTDYNSDDTESMSSELPDMGDQSPLPAGGTQTPPIEGEGPDLQAPEEMTEPTFGQQPPEMPQQQQPTRQPNVVSQMARRAMYRK